MKKANEVAAKVVDRLANGRQHPVGKVQSQVLVALDVTVKVNGFQHAEQIFNELGIVVSNRREGRQFVPFVTRRVIGGGFNAYGEGEESFELSNCVDLSSISQWMA